MTTAREWVRFNPLTYSYDTPDGTHIPAELADSVQCLADVVRIAQLRDQQRATAKPSRSASHG